jgi:polyvinyl alcohol dehydrogenase (cytochrome)
MRLLLVTAMLALLPTGTGMADPAATTPAAVSARGKEVYRTVCAACHDNPQTRAPNKAFLQQTRSSEYILRALTAGVMRDITASVSLDDKKAVATYLIGRLPSAAAEVNPDANRCKADPPPLSLDGSNWNGWGGQGVTNARYQASPGFTARDVPKLKLQWAFAYPGGVSSEPAVVGGRIFVSSMAGHLFSLDARTGCTYWHVDVGIPARAMVTVGKMPSGRAAVFATNWQGHVYARDPDTGTEIWKTQVEDHRAVRLTGSPTLFEGRLYVPVSSGEEVLAGDPKYECCTFRGSLVSLDSATGKIVWRAYTIDQTPRPLSDGKRMGPAGAAIWSAPTIDIKRRLVYAATGDDYSNPTTDASDAIIAYDLDTGKKRWTSQVFPNDAFIVGCDGAVRHANCPEGELGPDFDLGASPLLIQSAGKDLIVALTKGGVAFGLDPDANGKILWQTRLGRGGLLGGVEWGGATDGQRLFVPIGDTATSAVATSKADDDFPMKPGLNAVSPSGKLLWHAPAPRPACSWKTGDCTNAFTAAALAIPGIVFAGSRDGHIRAFAAHDGKLVWDYDTGRAFPAVNGGNANGGSIDHGAQTIANGMLYVNSGGRQGQPGNALLAFAVDNK